MVKGPRTWGSGASAPDDAQEQRSSLLTVIVISLLFAPMATVVAFATYQFGLVWGRLRVELLAVTAGAVGFLYLLFAGGPAHLFTALTLPHRELLAGLRDRNLGEVAAGQWPTWLVATFPASLVVGLAVGAAYSAWRWWRRPAWEESDRRALPWEKVRAQRVRKEIEADVNGPLEGVTVGVEADSGVRVVQSDIEGGAHTLVTGGSGTGKTTALLMQTRDVIRHGRGLVVIDLKGSADVPGQVYEWAMKHEREFYHWTLAVDHYSGPAEGPAYYEPVGRGDIDRRTGMLLATRNWGDSSDYYKKQAEGFLQLTLLLIDHCPPSGKDALTDIARLCSDIRALRDQGQVLFASEVEAGRHDHSTTTRGGITATVEPDDPWLDNCDRLAPGSAREILVGLRTYLDKPHAPNETTLNPAIRDFGAGIRIFKQSPAGRFLAEDPSGVRTIDLERAAREGEVVVFSLNSAMYPEPATSVATMILQDLKTVSADLRHSPRWFNSTSPRDRLHVYIDEFGAIESDNVKTMLQQVRDSRMSVTLSTQSIADLAYHSPEFKDALLNTVSSFLIMRPNTVVEAEELAGLTGGTMRTVKQIGIEHATSLGGIDTGAATGGGFLREEMGFVFPPEMLQNLGQGEGVFVSAGSGTRRAVHVKVIREASRTLTRTVETVPDAQPVRDERLPDLPEDARHAAAPDLREFTKAGAVHRALPTQLPTRPAALPSDHASEVTGAGELPALETSGSTEDRTAPAAVPAAGLPTGPRAPVARVPLGPPRPKPISTTTPPVTEEAPERDPLGEPEPEPADEVREAEAATDGSPKHMASTSWDAFEKQKSKGTS